MSRSLRRGALAAVLAITIAPLAAACGAGSSPQTLEIKPDSVAASVGSIQIENAFIVTEPKGGGPAAITARVFNNGSTAQQLTSITVHGATSPVKLTGRDGTPGPVTIPGGSAITLGGKGNPSAELASDGGIVAGDFQHTVFDFSHTGQVSLSPSVVPAARYFQPFGPIVMASPSASASAPAAGASGAPAPSASGAPSASASTAGTAAKAKTGTAHKPASSTSPKV